MKLKFYLLLLVLLSSTSAVLAQRVVTGKVLDETSEPLIGVTVNVKGGNTGALTDVNGVFTVRVSAGAEALVFSYTGYTTQEVALSDESTYDITLLPGAIGLEETVIVGYGSQSRKELTGAVAKVGGETISKLTVGGLDQAMQGQTAGVFVSAASGTPGASVSVRVRGASSISAANQPLYVVDGIPINNASNSQLGFGGQQTNSLVDINPADIESIEILKDAASASIYGSRASNGVILITTKRGKQQKTQVSLNSYYGTQETWQRAEPLTGPEYVSLLNEAIDNRYGVGNATGTATKAALGINKDPNSFPNTNWQNEIFRTAPITQTDVSLSGGNDRTKFFVSGAYFKQDGVIKGSSQDRKSFRVNLDNSVTDKLSVGTTTFFSSSEGNRINNDNNIFGVLSTAILMASHIPVYNPDGTYARDPNSSVENPVAGALLPTNVNTSNRLLTSVFAEYDILDNLSFRSNVSVDYTFFREFRFDPSTTNNGAGVRGRGIEASNIDLNLLNENFLTYRDNFGSLGVNAVGGVSFQKNTNNTAFLQGENFPGNTIQTLNAAAVKKDLNTFETVWGINSYFGRVSFDWKDMFIVSGSIRADGSSRFGADNRWGVFPSASAAVVLSEMGFLRDNNIISLLKVRGAWGERGNANIGNFASRSLIGPGANYNQIAGLAPTQLGNPGLTWEERTDIDFGLELGFFKNRVNLTAEAYKGNTRQLLLNRPLVTSSGYGGINENIGEMENQGIDLELQTVNISKKNFTWSTNVNFSFFKNKILKLAGAPFAAGFASWVEEGQSLGAFRGSRVVKVFQTQAEIDALNATAREKTGNANAVYQSTLTRPGDLMFKDINSDGVITGADLEILGNGNPDFFGGITNNVAAYGFDLSFFFQFQYGNDIYNNTRAFSEGMNSVFGQAATVRNRWTPTNPTEDTRYPRAVWADPNNNRRNSDRFLEDGSYIRLRNITLGYTLPRTVLSKIGLSKLRVYATGQNLLTFTNYSGLDPEVSTFGETNIAPGTDFLTFPLARVVSGGLQLTF